MLPDKRIFLFILTLLTANVFAQNAKLMGKITADNQGVEGVRVVIKTLSKKAISDSNGRYTLTGIPLGQYKIQISSLGFFKLERTIKITSSGTDTLNIDLSNQKNNQIEVVVSGTLKEVNRLESPVPVEVYNSTFFKKNLTANLFEGLANINGVRPQLNCAICNTGDIHINGLEGPYTMVLIDGMPIVSSLSTVYGLSGIPNSLIERIEVVKGPASSLYGSEAVGGLINVITKKPQNAPLFNAEVFMTTWNEVNADVSFKIKAKKIDLLTGINHFNYSTVIDNNNDNFTDVTLQKRISIFEKANFKRKDNKLFTLAGRYVFEDRWGGDINWTKEFRGGDSIYGESIYTNRWELLGSYQLPIKEKVFFSFSYNQHHQDSRYGNTSYIAQQNIGFGQLTWDKKLKAHDFLIGAALRQTFYDDNTPTTASADTLIPSNMAQNIWLPGVFAQDEITLSKKQKLLLGFRYDYNSVHGNIYTPRLAYKLSVNDRNIIRLNTGTGYRVVNLFTEDHSALTGARAVIINDDIRPEKSINVNLNYIHKKFYKNGTYISFDATAFYTHFYNRIIGDFLSDPNKISYNNLNGYAVSQGISANVDFSFNNGLKIVTGATAQDVTYTDNGVKNYQFFTEKFTATWLASYTVKELKLTIDYTGNLYSPMKLPLISELDPRSDKSPWWSIQNIQFTYTGFKKVEVFGGVKNLLNWTPFKKNGLLLPRTNDPFDKNVKYDANGQVIVDANNPYGFTFDTSYVYASNQGIRGFLGIRININ